MSVGLKIRECPLNRVILPVFWRRVQNGCPGLFDRLTYTVDLMSWQVVHGHDIAGRSPGARPVLHRLETLPRSLVCRAASERSCRKVVSPRCCCRLSLAVRNSRPASLPAWRTPATNVLWTAKANCLASHGHNTLVSICGYSRGRRRASSHPDWRVAKVYLDPSRCNESVALFGRVLINRVFKSV